MQMAGFFVAHRVGWTSHCAGATNCKVVGLEGVKDG